MVTGLRQDPEKGSATGMANYVPELGAQHCK